MPKNIFKKTKLKGTPHYFLATSLIATQSARQCGFYYSFIHSFWLFLQRLFKSTATQRRSRHSTDTVSEFHAKRHKQL